MVTMMMALALLAQGGTLPDDTAESARICGAAVPLIGGATFTERKSQSAFFALAAVRANRGSGDFNARLRSESAAMVAGQGSADAAVGPACKARFPAAWATRIALPADSFDRRFLCLMASSFAVGMVAKGSDPALVERYETINRRFEGNIPDTDFVAKGIRTVEDANALAERTLMGMVDLGHPVAVVAACEAAFPG